MSFVLQRWQLLHLIPAGCVNRQQRQVLEYLPAENQILREKLGKRRRSSSGSTFKYSYDPENRLTLVDYDPGGGALTLVARYRYDNQGRAAP